MKELIFNIGQIFKTTDHSCCLVQYDSEFFHIPAYQRGYKWGSETGGAVSVLLNDLWEAYGAYERKEKSEYYLQYITVKRNSILAGAEKVSCLEVIDGQQRLTTLSIFLSVIAAIIAKENISDNKLHYAIRENFFSENIYEAPKLLELMERKWDELKLLDQFNKQDLFYLFSAAKKSFTFFNERINDIGGFYKYLLSNVMLIVNSVEPHVESETVFKNLNSNKVPLTEAELIKGLLITKIGRDNCTTDIKHFREILELRMKLGRQWDEISRWAKDPKIQTFFFNEKEGIHELLRLTAIYLKKDGVKLIASTKENDFAIFNSFNTYHDTSKIYRTLKDIQATLNDWYNDDEIYNLIGYCRFVKGSMYNTLHFLSDNLPKLKNVLKKDLKQLRDEMIPDAVEKLRYKDDDNKIHAALLALSVFNSHKTRFNYYDFVTEKWSLEHIFPQSPEGKNGILDDLQKAAVITMLGDSISNKINAVLKKKIRNDEEKSLYYEALQDLSDLNSIGNMCLLTSGGNSSNGCMFFADKRANILKLIQKGCFVPKHTFDVFSKMIPSLEVDNISVWTKQDILGHQEYIDKTLKFQ